MYQSIVPDGVLPLLDRNRHKRICIKRNADDLVVWVEVYKYFNEPAVLKVLLYMQCDPDEMREFCESGENWPSRAQVVYKRRDLSASVKPKPSAEAAFMCCLFRGEALIIRLSEKGTVPRTSCPLP